MGVRIGAVGIIRVPVSSTYRPSPGRLKTSRRLVSGTPLESGVAELFEDGHAAPARRSGLGLDQKTAIGAEVTKAPGVHGSSGELQDEVDLLTFLNRETAPNEEKVLVQLDELLACMVLLLEYWRAAQAPFIQSRHVTEEIPS